MTGTAKPLAEQEQRVQPTPAVRLRARQIAAACIVVAVGAVGVAVFAYFSMRGAQRAEDASHASRAKAENLLGLLTEDYARELESSGRLKQVLQLAEREVEYFHDLPTRLRSASAVRLGVTALQQYARSARLLGKIPEAKGAVLESEALLMQLQKEGDQSGATAVALARAMNEHAIILSAESDPGAIPKNQAAFAILKPFSSLGDASLAVREVEAELFSRLGYMQQFLRDSKPAIPNLQRAMDIAAQHGALDLSNLRMTEVYVDASAWVVKNGVATGKPELAEKVGAEGVALAQKLLAVRPGNERAIYSQAVIAASLARAAADALRPAEASRKARRAAELQQLLVSMDPGNTVACNDLAAAQSTVGDALWSAGRIRESLQAYEAAVDSVRKASASSSSLKYSRIAHLYSLARRYVDAGDLARARVAQKEMTEQVEALAAILPKDNASLLLAQSAGDGISARMAMFQGDAAQALRLARNRLVAADSIPADAIDGAEREITRFAAADMAASAAIEVGDLAAAEKYARVALEAREKVHHGTHYDALELDRLSSKLAVALLGQSRAADAEQIMRPVINRRREVRSRNHDNADAVTGLIAALYVQGLLEPRQREVLLSEAATLLSRLPREFRHLHQSRYLLDLISDAQIGVMPWSRKAR